MNEKIRLNRGKWFLMARAIRYGAENSEVFWGRVSLYSCWKFYINVDLILIRDVCGEGISMRA